MKPTDNVGITFANSVLGVGTFNNVINITLGAMQFTPGGENGKVDPDMVITSRLRMDIPCAEALVESLSNHLAKVRARPPVVAEPVSADMADEGKPN